jgi:predicted enzyme related to lactoylglutathione lyase
MDRAVDFYTQVLGLAVTYRAGNHYCGLDAGNGMKVGLHPKSDKAPDPGTNGATQVGFNITIPIDQAVQELSQKGAALKGEIIDDANGAIRIAYLTDPDGNDLYLIESKW